MKRATHLKLAPRIVLIDDEDLLSWCIALELGARGYDVERASNWQQGKLALAHSPPDLIICDQGLPDGQGIALLKQDLKLSDHIPVIIITAFTPPAAAELAAIGAHSCLCKPFDLDTLAQLVAFCLQKFKPFSL